MLLVEWLTPLSHHHMSSAVYEVHEDHDLHDVAKFSKSELLTENASAVQEEELGWNIEPREAKNEVFHLKTLFDAVGFIIWDTLAHDCFDICSILESIMLGVCFQIGDDPIDALSE